MYCIFYATLVSTVLILMLQYPSEHDTYVKQTPPSHCRIGVYMTWTRLMITHPWRGRNWWQQYVPHILPIGDWVTKCLTQFQHPSVIVMSCRWWLAMTSEVYWTVGTVMQLKSFILFSYDNFYTLYICLKQIWHIILNTSVTC